MEVRLFSFSIYLEYKFEFELEFNLVAVDIIEGGNTLKITSDVFKKKIT